MNGERGRWGEWWEEKGKEEEKGDQREKKENGWMDEMDGVGWIGKDSNLP